MSLVKINELIAIFRETFRLLVRLSQEKRELFISQMSEW